MTCERQAVLLVAEHKPWEMFWCGQSGNDLRKGQVRWRERRAGLVWSGEVSPRLQIDTPLVQQRDPASPALPGGTLPRRLNPSRSS